MEKSGSPPAGTIALLFTDIEGSTQLARSLGAQWSVVLAQHHELLSRAILSEGGWIDGTEGDAFFATFSDPAAAGRAAVTAQRALRAHPWPAELQELRVRMGLHVGYVERRESGYVGLEVHRAARIAGAAHGGQLLLSSSAHEMLGEVVASESLGAHRLKDFPQAEHLYCAVVDGEGAAAFPPPRTESVRPTNLPAGGPTLVGREADLAQVLDAVEAQRERLICLTGRSGAGKTSLALVAAAQLLESFPGGVWLVALASVPDPAGVTAAIAAAVGAGTQAEGSNFDAIVQLQRDRGRTLLVVDNMEHVLEAATELARLLEALPDLQVLATSQAPLHLAHELCLPLDALEDEAALALVERVARRRNPTITVNGRDRPALLELVRLLDGLPLAIELAAARLALLTPAQLLSRLRDSPDILRDDRADRPERHRSLRATAEWSLGLLDPPGRLLFTRLGVFAGPVELEDIEAVCGGSGLDVLGELFRLVELALVRRVESGDGRIRFGLPEGLRRIAAEQLDSAPDGELWRRAHAARQHELVWPARHIFVNRTTYRAAADATAERRAAIRWAQAAADPLAEPLACAHSMLASDRGNLRDALETLEPLVPHVDPALRGLALTALSWTYIGVDRFQDALRAGDESVASATGPRDRALALLVRCCVHAFEERHADGVRDADEGLALARDQDAAFLCGALMLCSQAHAYAGELELAVELLEEAERVGAPSDADFVWRSHTLHGDMAVMRGHPADALEHYAQSLEEAELREHDLQILFDLVGVALALAALEHDEAAVELEGTAAQHAAEIGGPGAGALHLLGDARLQEARQRLGAVAADAERRGRAVPPAERVKRACQLARGRAAVLER